MSEETSAVVVTTEGDNVSVHGNADGWSYTSMGADSTVLALLPREQRVDYNFQNVLQVMRVEGEEAEILIEQAEKGNI